MSQKPKTAMRQTPAMSVVSAPFVVETVAEPVKEAAIEAAPVAEPMTEVATIAAPVPAEEAPAAPAIETLKSTPQPTMENKIMKTAEEFVAFNQANIEAFVKSGQIWSAGVQELTKQFAATAKASFDESVATFKAISSVKSLKEAIDLQTSFTKTAIEKSMVESKTITDQSMKLTEAALAPITARVTVAVESFSKAA